MRKACAVVGLPTPLCYRVYGSKAVFFLLREAASRVGVKTWAYRVRASREALCFFALKALDFT